jgi:uncharacterized protein (UPF0335 family)
MARRRKSDNGSDGPKIGHNSHVSDEARVKLQGFVQEIERVDAKVRELTSERGTIYKSAKEQGFDTKALKHVVKMRRMESSKRKDFEVVVDAYMQALGMLADTPLGQAAAQRDLGISYVPEAQPAG